MSTQHQLSSFYKAYPTFSDYLNCSNSLAKLAEDAVGKNFFSCRRYMEVLYNRMYDKHYPEETGLSALKQYE